MFEKGAFTLANRATNLAYKVGNDLRPAASIIYVDAYHDS